MTDQHCALIVAALDRIAGEAQRIADLLEVTDKEVKAAAEAKAILDERIADAQSRRNHPSRYVP